MISFMVICTEFAWGQDHQLMNNGTWTPTTTNFLQSFPFPATTSTATQSIVGKGYDFIDTRGIFFGGNLGVSQHTFNYEHYRGKWSFKGAWMKPTTLTPGWGSISGINYLIDYHRWDDYSAHFGLKERNTFELVPETPTYDDVRDAVISWGYEAGGGITPNRLIFQSIEGTDVSVSTNHIATEWATILSNGNIGSGISNPFAQFEINPIADPSGLNPLSMQIFDDNGFSTFRYYKAGKLALGTTSSITTIPSALLDVNGDINVVGTQVIKSPSFATGTDKVFHLKDNTVTPGPKDLFYIQNNGNATLALADLFIPSISGGLPTSTTIPKNLAIDYTGKIVSTSTPFPPNTVWQVGGNSFAGGSVYEIGTSTYDDVNLWAGGVTSFSISGALATRGQMKIIKATSIGGNTTIGYATPNPDWALTMKPIATGTGQGSLRILNSSNVEIFGAFDTYLGFHGNAFRVFDTEIQTRISIRPEFGYSNCDLGYSVGGSSNGAFRDIWYHGDATDVSDRRVKENIKNLDYGLAEILKLNPTSYFQIISKRVELGFIAQELAEVLPECVYIPENDSNLYGVRYMQIIPVLANAIKEQNAIIDSLKQKLDLVFSSSKINDVQDIGNQKEVLNEVPLLFQNHPNPFNGITFIDYFLPKNATNAFLRVIDNNGKLVKAFTIYQTGFGQVELDCSNLSEGQYHYSLLVNSKLIDTKTMIISAGNN